MIDLKVETKTKFKELYKEFPELIEYRIQSGNLYEKAQATLIKTVAVSDLQAPDCLEASCTCKIASEEPLPKQISNNGPCLQ
jgi:hypothetical protein